MLTRSKTFEYQQRLKNLLPNSPKWIDILSKDGVIAGGSVVYAMNDFVPLETVGDIDVFVNTKTTLIELIQMIISDGGVDKIELMCNYLNDTLDHQEPVTKGSVCTIHFSDQSMKSIQFILKEFKNVNKVINDFDLDYVQCAYHIGQFHITSFAKESHQTRSVIFAMQKHISVCRLMKAVEKGFSAPAFGFPRNKLLSILLKTSPTEEQLVYINSRTNLTTPYKIREQISPIVKIVPKQSSYPVTKRHLERCSIQKIFFDFGVKDFMKSFSIRVFVEEVNPFGQSNSCKVSPIRIGNVVIKKLIYSHCPTFQPEMNHSYNILVSLYTYFVPQLEYDDDYKFQVSMILESNRFVSLEPTNFDSKVFFPIADLQPSIYCASKSRRHLNSKEAIVKHIENLIKTKTDSKWQSDIHKANAYRAFLYYFVQENKSEEEAAKSAASQITWDSMKRNQRSPADFFMMMIPEQIVKNHFELVKYVEKFSRY